MSEKEKDEMFQMLTKFHQKVFRPELDKLRGEMKQGFAETASKAEVREGFKRVREEMATKAEMVSMGNRLSREISELRGEMGLVKINHEKRIRRVETKLCLPHSVAME